MFWPFSRNARQNSGTFARQFSALIDTSTGAVLTIGMHPSAIVFLEENMPDTSQVHNVNSPNYRESFRLTELKGGEFPDWRWDWKTRLFSHMPVRAVTSALRDRSRIATAKLETISSIMLNLSQARSKVRTGVEFQETVYITKRLQAQAFKASGYDEDRALEFPYVLQYADFAGISLATAADDIIFKSRLDEELLSKTELLRLKYFNLVRNATKVEELPPILEAFARESYKNALI